MLQKKNMLHASPQAELIILPQVAKRDFYTAMPLNKTVRKNKATSPGPTAGWGREGPVDVGVAATFP